MKIPLRFCILVIWRSPDKCIVQGNTMKVGTTYTDGCQECTCTASFFLTCKTVSGCVDMDIIHVVIPAEKHTLSGVVALINSIQQHSNSSILCHLVSTENLQECLLEWLQEVELTTLSYNLVAVDYNWLPDLGVYQTSKQDIIGYVAAFLPYLFPEIHGKIIYITPSAIVQGDIMELWKTKIKPGDLAAFSSDCTHMAKRGTIFNNHYSSFFNFVHPVIKQLNLKPEACSFDTGVFVTDLQLWRQNNVSDDMKFWININSKENLYGHPNTIEQQPLFMIVFYRKYTELDPFWNFRNFGSDKTLEYSNQFLEHAHLLQWNGHIKPWERGAKHSSLWEKYYIPDPLGNFLLDKQL